jgi:Mre11 DNA-binding presumed domain
VLIRLVVEHTGFNAVSNSRFGAQFLGQVANAGDMLLFRRQKKTAQPGALAAARAAAAAGMRNAVMPDNMEEVRVSSYNEYCFYNHCYYC